MKKGKTTRFDVSEYLKTDEDIAAYLNVVLGENDPDLVVAALGDIARSKGMTKLAKDSGLTRASLYKSLSAGGNPEFNTVIKVVNALGIKLEAVTPMNIAKKRPHTTRTTTDRHVAGARHVTRDRRGAARRVGRRSAAS